MRIVDHLAKARRYEASLRRLDPVEDLALVVWSAMNCGTNLVNAALHRLGVTDERDGFATHHEHSYVAAAPGSAPPRFERVRYERGDLIHAFMPKLAAGPPAELAAAFEALKAIEDMRPLYVRGSAPYSREASVSCLVSLAAIKDVCGRIIGDAAGR